MHQPSAAPHLPLTELPRDSAPELRSLSGEELKIPAARPELPGLPAAPSSAFELPQVAREGAAAAAASNAFELLPLLSMPPTLLALPVDLLLLGASTRPAAGEATSGEMVGVLGA